MTEKDFKKIISDKEINNSKKNQIESKINELVNTINNNLPNTIKINSFSKASWNALNLYNNDIVYLAIDLDLNGINDLYKVSTTFKAIEVSLVLSGATKIEVTNHTIKCNLNDTSYVIELNSNILTPVTYISEYLRALDEASKTYTLLKNTLVLINHFIVEEDIKNINTYLLLNILLTSVKKDNTEAKYYKYLQSFVKLLDELLNNKKFEIAESISNDLMNLNLTEVKLQELRKLRKAIVKATAIDEEIVKFDSQTEVIVDVNPLLNEQTNTYAWSYSLVGRNLQNSGGIYTTSEEDYQTAILKGVFKGLKAVVDNNLSKKKVILKCDYEGILTSKMLSNDENKSRMKTINSLIEANNLKVNAK